MSKMKTMNETYLKHFELYLKLSEAIQKAGDRTAQVFIKNDSKAEVTIFEHVNNPEVIVSKPEDILNVFNIEEQKQMFGTKYVIKDMDVALKIKTAKTDEEFEPYSIPSDIAWAQFMKSVIQVALQQDTELYLPSIEKNHFDVNDDTGEYNSVGYILSKENQIEPWKNLVSEATGAYNWEYIDDAIFTHHKVWRLITDKITIILDPEMK